MTTIDSALRRAAPPSPPQTPIVVYASVVANVLIAAVCVLLAISIFNLQPGAAESSTVAVDQLLRLGRPVVVFVGLVALMPALVAVFSTVQLLRRNISGRYAALVLQGLGLVFCLIALVHLWGFFNSFEIIVDGIVQNPWLLLGIPMAYALFWIGGRFSTTTTWGSRLETVGIFLGIANLIVVLFVANILTFANNILSAYANPVTWIATVLAVIFGILAWRLLHEGHFFRETQDQLVAWQGWLMLSPNIIGFMIFFAGPLLLSFYLSFTNNTVGKVPDFIGAQNYTDILSLELKWLDDPQAAPQTVMSFGFTPLGTLNLGGRMLVMGAKDALFWISLRNTILFCLLLVPLSVIPALGLAMVLNSKLPGVNFFRAVYFLPSVAAVVGTALIWRWLYDPTIGFINYGITQLVNFLNSLGLQLVDPQIQWLTGPGVVLFSIVILSAWQVVGFNTVLFLAGLQGISKELYEASSIDGANRWETFWFITLPMLAPTTFFVIITTVITGLQVFNEPYALFPSRPIPENATTSVFYLYNQGFFRFNFGYASAIAWVLFALIFLMTLAQFRLQRSNAYEG
jgi:ABC-type sugar transport system permease subunit